MQFTTTAIAAICAVASLSTSALAGPVARRNESYNSTGTSTTLSSTTSSIPAAATTAGGYVSEHATLCPYPSADWDVSRGSVSAWEPATAQVYRTNGKDTTHLASFDITADLAAYQCDLVLDLGETGNYAGSPLYQVWTSLEPITRNSQSNHRNLPFGPLMVQKTGRSVIKSFPCSNYAGRGRLSIEISPLSEGQGMFWSTNEYGLRIVAH